MWCDQKYVWGKQSVGSKGKRATERGLEKLTRLWGERSWKNERKLSRHNVGRGATASFLIPDIFFPISIKGSRVRRAGV